MDVNELSEEEKIRIEVSLVGSQGWEVRKAWILALRNADADALIQGTLKDDVVRERAVGRCQMADLILMRDSAIEQSWQELQAEAQEPPEELEGGDHGIDYEAAQ